MESARQSGCGICCFDPGRTIQWIDCKSVDAADPLMAEALDVIEAIQMEELRRGHSVEYKFVIFADCSGLVELLLVRHITASAVPVPATRFISSPKSQNHTKK